MPIENFRTYQIKPLNNTHTYGTIMIDFSRSNPRIPYSGSANSGLIFNHSAPPDKIHERLGYTPEQVKITEYKENRDIRLAHEKP